MIGKTSYIIALNTPVIDRLGESEIGDLENPLPEHEVNQQVRWFEVPMEVLACMAEFDSLQ